MTWGRRDSLFYCWMSNEIHFHWKNYCLLLFTMHPSNLDHKDMQRRGVQTFQAGEIVGLRVIRWIGTIVVLFYCIFPHKLNLTPHKWAMSELWFTPQGLRSKNFSSRAFGKAYSWLLGIFFFLCKLSWITVFLGRTFGKTLSPRQCGTLKTSRMQVDIIQSVHLCEVI